MIKIRDGALSAEAGALLEQYQHEVDQAGDYPARVEAAKSKFRARNNRTNPAFVEVRRQLTGMCSGLGRCMYCEDAPADEVEHHRPKDLYPERVFVWSNYLYACGPCNGPKNNRFAVLDPGARALIDVTRPRGAAIIPPAPGAPALLDPRREDPLDFMMLDLLGTFYLVPLHDPGSPEYLRADYTIEVLRLNARDMLVAARADAFNGYRARLREYIHQRDTGASPSRLDVLKAGFQRAPHATVWAEMKRQHPWHRELADLFDQAPEALDF